MGPAIIVFPDCFTELGGNQYVNSSAIGDYADYLTREIIPFVDREFRTLASREHRGCFGKSSGGYGSIIHGMKYAKYWGAIADHSGDACFDFVYWHDWPNARSPSFARPGASPAPTTRASSASCSLHSCMAATYDPDPRAPLGFRIPFNAESGEAIEARWRNWRRHDPINLVAKTRENLKSLRGITIDCGWRDQYHIHYGSRILSQRLAEAGVRHRYEEFDDDHSDIDYRMDVSLPFLYRALMR